MSGIANYFHGEGGQVVDFGWVADEDSLTYEMRLAGDPHRELAFDYGSDIAIDPALRPGDRAVYIRMGPYSGAWVQEEDQYSPRLDLAFERAADHRRPIHDYIALTSTGIDEARSWAESTLAASTGIPVRMRSAADAPSEKPATAVSIFLSYSSRNALMARQFFEYLQEDAKADVWFDLTQPGEAPYHDQAIERWLEGAIHECEVFLVLLTRASVRSNWVRKEITAAIEKGGRWGRNSHLVCLNLEGVNPPDDLPSRDYVIDCWGLVIGEILEELYAAVYKRIGRVKWLEEQRRRGWHEEDRHGLTGYAHLMSDGGTAKGLTVKRRGESLHWALEYTVREPDGSEHARRAEGSDEAAIVDLGIRAGDRVGCFTFDHDTPLWMRSADLTLDPFEVNSIYQRKLTSPTSAVRACNVLLALVGFLVVALIARISFESLKSAFTGEPPGVSPELLAGAAGRLRILVTAAIVISGLYQLVSHSHPYQFEHRNLKSAIKYSAKALAIIAAVALAHTLSYGFVLLIAYVFTVGLVISIVASLAGAEGMGVVIQGFVVAYAGWVAYSIYRLAKLVRESPDYIYSPRFSWL